MLSYTYTNIKTYYKLVQNLKLNSLNGNTKMTPEETAVIRNCGRFIACAASVSVGFESKGRPPLFGAPRLAALPFPQSFFAPQPHGDACLIDNCLDLYVSVF